MLRTNHLSGFGGDGTPSTPIEFVGGKISQKTGATSGTTSMSLTTGLTGGIASSVSDGDLIIAAHGTAQDLDTTMTITDGSTNYTLIGSELYFSGGSEDGGLRVAYKFATASDTQTVFGPSGGLNFNGVTAVYVFRNVNASTPLDVAANTITNTGVPNPPAITPLTSGARIVCVGASVHIDGAGSTYTSSDLSNFFTLGSAPGSKEGSLGIGSVVWSGGTFDAAAFGFGGVADASGAITFALRPS